MCPKGGARVASAKRPVGRAMGLPVFFRLLEELQHRDRPMTVEQLHRALHFGGRRSETCRAFVQEAERLAMVKASSTLRQKYYRLSDEGKKFLMIPLGLRSNALAWYLTHLEKEEFEQLFLIIETLKEKNLPTDYARAGQLSGVEKHAAKVILFGWLEPTGLVRRTSTGREFTLNMDYYRKSTEAPNPQDLFPPYNPLRTEARPPYLVESPEMHHKASCEVVITNLSPSIVPVRLSITLNEIVRPYVTSFDFSKRSVTVGSLESKSVPIIIQLGGILSESFAPVEAGSCQIEHASGVVWQRLPLLHLVSKAEFYEITIKQLMERLALNVIRKGKSDRPDLIVSPVRIKQDTNEFLRGEEFKIFVEITSTDVLSSTKVQSDLDKFERHKEKVEMMSGGRRQLILGPTIASDVEEKINAFATDHPFTVMSVKDLEYLVQKCEDSHIKDWALTGRILCFDGLVKRHLIDRIFNEYTKDAQGILQKYRKQIIEVLCDGYMQTPPRELVEAGLLVRTEAGYMPSSILLKLLSHGVFRSKVSDLIDKYSELAEE